MPRPVAARLPAALAAVAAALLGAGGAAAHASPSLRALAAQYLVIANAGNQRLEAELDPLAGRDRNNLARARADLSDAAATERLFDSRLLRIAFPPAIEQTARELYRANQTRATLTAAAATATTLQGVHSYEPLLAEDNAAVERPVRTIRRQLGLPPPDTS